MKPVALRRPLLRNTLSYIPAMLFLLGGAVMIGGSALYAANSVKEHGFSIPLCLVSLALLSLACIFVVAFFQNLWEICTQVTMSSDGIMVHRFGHKWMSILWSDLAEVGITLSHGRELTRYLYFSLRHWDDYERADVSMLSPSNGSVFGLFDCFDLSGIVWVKCSQVENQAILRKLCPLPLPLIGNYSSQSDLVSYRRDHLPDGTWGAAYPVRMTADDVMSKYNSRESHAIRKQRKRAKKL